MKIMMQGSGNVFACQVKNVSCTETTTFNPFYFDKRKNHIIQTEVPENFKINLLKCLVTN